MRTRSGEKCGLLTLECGRDPGPLGRCSQGPAVEDAQGVQAPGPPRTPTPGPRTPDPGPRHSPRAPARDSPGGRTVSTWMTVPPGSWLLAFFRLLPALPAGSFLRPAGRTSQWPRRKSPSRRHALPPDFTAQGATSRPLPPPFLAMPIHLDLTPTSSGHLHPTLTSAPSVRAAAPAAAPSVSPRCSPLSQPRCSPLSQPPLQPPSVSPRCSPLSQPPLQPPSVSPRCSPPQSAPLNSAHAAAPSPAQPRCSPPQLSPSAQSPLQPPQLSPLSSAPLSSAPSA
ncbi:vegetative cell wall protein gp1-like [Peromyscus leucopus]|uniref:vegetative cell wall protein gp1-like n=1 Tax=Peromyscus leucopus TaxID=10041 RepID=UPI0010A1EA04|nr:vegetative cell wall protein gp1-like [Peromyscus leucopus]